MKYFFGALVSSSLILSGIALADSEEGTQKENLSVLKAKCAELAANQQIKPFKVQVTCRQTGHVWKPGQQSQLAIKSHREVGASIRMKNVELAYQGKAIEDQPTMVNCPVYDKWDYVVPAVDVQLNCEELTKIENLAEFCLPLISQRAAQEPGIVQQQKTNDTVNLCNGNLR